ncbi:MAG: T9SS type A sorting domain-containing protein [Chitinophagales bacterium]|nr:T9SS type A sorting domain-containing protein [Chitinophagales bacterium]
MKRGCLIIGFVLSAFAGITQVIHFKALGYDNLPITGLGNWHVLVSDLNGDSFDDLYITREAQKDIMFYGSANGIFEEQNISNKPWNTPLGSLDIVSADLNGDGLNEMIISKTPYNGSSNDLIPSKDVILKNMGNGNYTDVSNNLPAELSAIGFCIFPDIDATNYTTGVATGLLNADSIPDIIMVNGGISYLPRLELFNNSPIVCKEKLKNDIYFSSGIDINADGIDDYTNAPSNISLNKYQDLSTDVAIADFNGDGLEDIFVANFYDKTILDIAQLNDSSGFSKLYINDQLNPGDFTWKFGEDLGFPLEKYPATSIDAADFDRDGDIDIIVGIERRGDTLFNVEFSTAMISRIFQNDADGNFTDRTAFQFPPFKDEYLSCYDIQFVDFNNDGWLDVYGAGITSFLFIQDDTINHTFIDKTYLLPTSQAHPENNITHTYHTYGAGFSDFDNNGTTDIILANTYEQLHLLFQTENGQFIDTTTTNLPPDGQNTEYAAIADFTGDGLPDIIKVNNDIKVNTHSFYIQTASINDHLYFSSKGYQIPLDATFIRNYGVDYHDIDNDNDFDILISGESGIKLYENDGSGNFTENNTWLAGISGTNYSTRVKFVDINGDGDKDIFVPRAQNLTIGQSNKILIWSGNAYIDVSTSLLPANANPSLDVDFADLNGDNWMDFVVANHSGGSNLYLSNESGLYTISNAFTALSSSTTLKFAQLDDDNLIDVIQVNENVAENAVIYKNNGSTPFYTNATIVNNSEEASYDVVSHDFNDDGFNDLLIAGFSESNRIFINDGNMAFLDSTSFYLPDTSLGIGSFTKAIKLSDVNQDGIIDIYLARDNQDLLLYGQASIVTTKEFNSAFDESITVFPNPSQDYVTIDFKNVDSNQIYELYILSEDGRVVEKKTATIADNVIDLSNLPEGLYFIIVRQENKYSLVSKFIKTN